jgi:hypothetical protein
MKSLTEYALLLALLSGTGLAASEAKPRTENAAFTFRAVEYHHRWSKDDQHEYTPSGQEDLSRWTEMITINRYRSVTDGDGLAATANAVLGTYKANRAIVVRTDSVPRTPDKPAEYLIVVLFPQPTFIEAVFARFKIVGGMGTAAIFGHREYGEKSGDLMSAWLKTNGPDVEKALMGWEGIPLPDDVRR